MDTLLSLAGRVMLLGALALAALAVAEGVVQLFGQSLTGSAYKAGRLLEFSAMVMVLAIGLLLREIRNDSRAPGRSAGFTPTAAR